MLTVFLITKPAIGSEVMRPEYSYKADHPEPNLIITSGDIIHKNIYDDQSGKVLLIMIIKFELKLWKCKITYINSDNGSTSQCTSILTGIFSLISTQLVTSCTGDNCLSITHLCDLQKRY